ncbi:ATPase, F0 complex, subunit J [Phanerochaete sordida]|uniref:ATPase, F0 complex, subunit J n=1 Tax=Phanerochaete sordida TaxID=48140 RepID=A0A9P3GRH2_9APHY|nr:ATPase, F0 complex, subunit J [Phanerochaete sordida]
MAFLGLRVWPTPVLRPMWPFIAASGLTFFLVSKAQDMGVRSEQYKNDPRNPYREQIAKEEAAKHH